MSIAHQDAIRAARDRYDAAMIKPRRVLSAAKAQASARRIQAHRTLERSLREIDRELQSARSEFAKAQAEAKAVEAIELRVAHQAVRIVNIERPRRAKLIEISQRYQRSSLQCP